MNDMSRKKEKPFFVQLREKILCSIENGLFQPGEKIPTEPELMEKYSASITTVRKAIQDLCEAGFLAKRQGAGTFVLKKEKKVGLVTPYLGDSWIPMWEGLKDAAKKHSFLLKLYPYVWGDGGDFLENFELCTKENNGAVIYLPYHDYKWLARKIGDLQSENYPMVFIEKKIDTGSGKISSIQVDYQKGFTDLITAIKRKYKRVGALIDMSHSTGTGLYNACRKCGLDEKLVEICEIHFDETALHKSVDMLLKNSPEVIVGFSSLTTINTYRHLKLNGIKVPENITLTGAGNLTSLANLMIPMKALKFPRREMGENGGNLIAELLKNPENSKNITLKPEVVKLNEDLDSK